MKKITIVGAGRVGEACAQVLAKEEQARDIVLLDINDEAAKGTALDIQECAPILQFDSKVIGGSDPKLMEGSELIIVTAGFPRKPGMSRQDVLGANLPIIDGICANTLKYAPNAMMLVVSNPVDILTYRAYQQLGWPRNRIFGQAGVLDASRMASFVAMETGFSAKDINAMVLGGHGDSMVPMMRYTTVSGIPVSNFMNQQQINAIVDRTRKGGAEILALKKNSSAYDAPGASTAEMVDAICKRRNRILPTVCILEGEYGQTDIAMGVPAILGVDGIQQVVELTLNDEEQSMFDASAAQLVKDIEEMKQLGVS